MKYLLGLVSSFMLANVALADQVTFCMTDRVTGIYYCGPIDDGAGMGEG